MTDAIATCPKNGAVEGYVSIQPTLRCLAVLHRRNGYQTVLSFSLAIPSSPNSGMSICECHIYCIVSCNLYGIIEEARSTLEAVAGLWRAHMRELAQRPNVYCKLSGMVTEADWVHWLINDLLFYVDVALEYFGPQRILAGSDWPACTVAASYERWWQTLRELISRLSPSERESILGGNAAHVYRLKGNMQ
jgi:hypothetical protein